MRAMGQNSAGRSRNMGIGIAFGLVIGVVISAATGNAALIGVGLPIGVAVGAAMDQESGDDSSGERSLLVTALIVGGVALAALIVTHLLVA